MSNTAHVELLRASGLFNPDFYREIYGHWLAENEDPLDHFLAVGLEQGYLPSADFDPVLYKVLVPECGNENPLLHSHTSGVPFRPRRLRDLFPDIAAAVSFKGNVREDADVERNRAYARDAAATKDIPLIVDGNRYLLRVPEPETFIERLRADRPFAYARLPHGFWDALWMFDVTEAGLAADARARTLSPAQRRALAIRLCASLRSIHGGFAPSFIDEVIADIPLHAARPDFFRGVSFKGYPTHDEDVFGRRVVPPGDAVARIFARHFRTEEVLYDGTLWKRLLIAGYLEELPALCRGRPVVVVASKPFSELGMRWQLDDFTHIEIPLTLTQWQRWDLLTRTSQAVAAACARSGRPPVVLTRCGGSLAFWLITRLFTEYPRVFYVDLGQALGGWFFDVLEVGGSAWARIYANPVIANCHLEPFYRARLGTRYDEWLNALSNRKKSPRKPRRGPRAARDDTTENGGTMRSDDRKNGTLEVHDFVKTVKARQPALFDAEVTDEAAGALLMQAFQVLQERLNQVPEGQLKIQGLGTFRVRVVERGENGARETRRVIHLNIGQKESKPD